MHRREFHPLAECFPPLEEKELSELATDIAANGLHHPIVLFEEKILDGRNRYLACIEAGVEPRFEEYSGKDPSAYVVGLNLRRRHLNQSQRSMIAARLANVLNGSNRHITQLNQEERLSLQTCTPTDYTEECLALQACTSRTVGKTANLLQISPRTVHHARVVLQEGTQEEIALVEKGKAGVTSVAPKIIARRRKAPAKTDALENKYYQQKLDAACWADLRKAMDHLTNILPEPQRTLAVARRYDRRGGGDIEKHLGPVISFLKELQNAWNNKDSGNNRHTGNGDIAA